MRGATAIEDYVKVIYGHTEWQPEKITTTELAARLGLAASSVTEMVKKLVTAGLVNHEPYGAIELTPDGTALALRMVRRHRLIETWLVNHVGFSWDEVHDEAEVLEHAMSDRVVDAIDDQLGNPTRDPHGDPIPDRNGAATRVDAALLVDMPVGASGAVVRISDRDPLLLRRLETAGVALDSIVTRTGAGVREVDLDAEALESIWVTTL